MTEELEKALEAGYIHVVTFNPPENGNWEIPVEVDQPENFEEYSKLSKNLALSEWVQCAFDVVDELGRTKLNPQTETGVKSTLMLFDPEKHPSPDKLCSQIFEKDTSQNWRRNGECYQIIDGKEYIYLEDSGRGFVDIT